MKSDVEPSKPRRKRDPNATRLAILEAAKKVLAEDGHDALSVSRVAHIAGVNRGTAYQHFQTREELLHATLGMVSEQLTQSVFLDPQTGEIDPTRRPVTVVVENMVKFAMENPELSRIWLFDVLSSSKPSDDKFFKLLEESTQYVVDKGYSYKDVDTEALSVIFLAGYFIWPVWVRSHARSKKDRDQMADRMTREILRLSLYGFLPPNLHPNIVSMLKEKADD